MIERRAEACLAAGNFTNQDRQLILEGVHALHEMLTCLAQDRPLPDPVTLCPLLKAAAA